MTFIYYESIKDLTFCVILVYHFVIDVDSSHKGTQPSQRHCFNKRHTSQRKFELISLSKLVFAGIYHVFLLIKDGFFHITNLALVKIQTGKKCKYSNIEDL